MKIPKPKKLFKKKEKKEEEKQEPIQELEVTPPETQQKTIKSEKGEEIIKLETPTDQLLYATIQRLDILINLEIQKQQAQGIIKPQEEPKQTG